MEVENVVRKGGVEQRRDHVRYSVGLLQRLEERPGETTVDFMLGEIMTQEWVRGKRGTEPRPLGTWGRQTSPISRRLLACPMRQ